MDNFVKKSYEQIVKVKSGGDYEQARWFSTAIRRAGFDMTRQTIIKRVIRSLPDYHNYLEIGPGPGTWTKLFLEKNNKAQYDLVDISEEMLDLAKQNLANQGNINFFCKDFLEFEPDRQYDYFFSSRALEYIINKPEAVKKIAQCLSSGGEGFIITKTPKYARQRMLGKKISALHKNQVSFKRLKELLEENNCQIIGIYPATISIPLFHSALINKSAFAWLARLPFNFISQFFSESYAIKFKKL